MAEYDILFLGGGPAGYEGAVYAAKKGLKTAVVEENAVGGTCLQWGCIPTKFLLHFVKSVKAIREGKREGLECPDYRIDVPRLAKRKSAVVNKLTRGITHLFDEHGIQLYTGRGKIEDAGRIRVDEKILLTAEHLVIATGSRPATLPFLDFDREGVMDSTRALELSSIPDRMLVVGAGAVGLELGQIYHYLGSRVTVVEILDQILPGSDGEITAILSRELNRQKIRIHTGTRISNPRREADKLVLKFKKDDGETFEDRFDRVLLSVGRVPNTDDLWGSKVPLKTDSRGFVEVDEKLRTTVAGIFACGDVIGGELLAHKASHQARQVVDRITGDNPAENVPVPAAVFTIPELAAVGITEEEARKKGLKYRVGRFPYAAGSRSNAEGDKSGLVKIIGDPSGRILGGHIVGTGAAELIQVINLAMGRNLSVNDFRELVTVHPTFSENVTEALGELGGFSIHI